MTSAPRQSKFKSKYHKISSSLLSPESSSWFSPESRVQSPGFVLSPIDITQDFPLSSELQGRDIGMVSYDAILYASLETRVAKYYNN